MEEEVRLLIAGPCHGQSLSLPAGQAVWPVQCKAGDGSDAITWYRPARDNPAVAVWQDAWDEITPGRHWALRGSDHYLREINWVDRIGEPNNFQVPGEDEVFPTLGEAQAAVERGLSEADV